jgi:ankyrin repeat protein
MNDAASFLESVLAGEVAAVTQRLVADRSLLHTATDEAFDRGMPPGSTALHIAVRCGHGPVVDALIAAGASLDARNSAGRTALHDALEFDHDMRDRLIEGGATIDICHAAFMDLADRVRELLLDSFELSRDRTTGLTPLGWACYGNASRSARVLMEFGVIPGPADLVRAAQVAGVRAGRVLLDRGVEIDARHDGFNALHAALTTPYTDDLVPFVTLLLEYGANANVKTTAGRLPLDLLAHARTLPASPERTASLDMCEALLRNAGARESAR